MNAPDPTTLTFDERGLIVTVAQDAASGTVLMVAYMNRAALDRTVASGEAHFWSRRRDALWRKGETSGNVLHVERIQADCDGDALLLSVHPSGPACHTGRRACFAEPATVLDGLDLTLRERKATRPSGSYTAGLFAQGREAILRKVGEEAVEVLLAGVAESDDALVGEVADLWFHSLVLLADRDLGPADVLRVLAGRRRGAKPPA
ncbi:MAG TPA: bifunctional phosphoribosyl-AMP cyclohydrolase/phosphoribosyl-ATP diphosphatase HisIE [Candidatus Limnocylindrales bacterium]|nr:bifunctional phosphoribosyl-AMP cyclohydrolase/phosphoribosyl-ATP diphosphatase HisIE [Candidatus Limnocylindrales bacterium]